MKEELVKTKEQILSEYVNVNLLDMLKKEGYIDNDGLLISHFDTIMWAMGVYSNQQNAHLIKLLESARSWIERDDSRQESPLPLIYKALNLD